MISAINRNNDDSYSRSRRLCALPTTLQALPAPVCASDIHVGRMWVGGRRSGRLCALPTTLQALPAPVCTSDIHVGRMGRRQAFPTPVCTSHIHVGRMNKIAARELFEQLRERLGLRWVGGRAGENRVVDATHTVSRRPSLAGYLNIIYPNRVQILGAEELAWLDGLDARLRWETLQKIVNNSPLAMVISKDQACPSDLREAAEDSGTPLWVSPRRGHELLNLLQYHLARVLAPQVTMHGVFMEIYSIGVLITGESGSGKSELALELISARPPAGRR